MMNHLTSFSINQTSSKSPTRVLALSKAACWLIPLESYSSCLHLAQINQFTIILFVDIVQHCLRVPRTNVEHLVPTHFSGCLWPVTIHLMITNHACWGESSVRCSTSLLKQQKKVLKQSKVDTSRVLWSSSINYFKLLPQESANPEELYGKYYFQLISSICQYNINSPLNDQKCHYLKII